MKAVIRTAIVVTGLAFVGAGCDPSALNGVGSSLTTKSVANPVTKTDEAEIELAVDSVIQIFKAYKAACKAGTADKHCTANIAQLQVYTRQIGPIKTQLRSFVDSNDQVNATVVFNQLLALLTNVKTVATGLGVNMASTPSTT
jgi:hypothetical protein